MQTLSMGLPLILQADVEKTYLKTSPKLLPLSEIKKNLVHNMLKSKFV